MSSTCIKWNLSATKKKSGPLLFRYRQVSLYCLGICLEGLREITNQTVTIH